MIPWAVLLILALALPACSNGEGGTQSAGGTAVEGKISEGGEPGAQVTAAGDAATAEAASGAVVPREDFDRKIVKTADLGTSSEDVRGGAARAQQVAARFGGTIASAQTYRAENAVIADLIISVPSEEFEAAIDELRGLGEEVTTDTVSG